MFEQFVDIDSMAEVTDNNSFLSIIIPFFNGERFLKYTLDSVINQPCKNIEVLLVDDGSNDNSKNICNEYCEKDKRVHYIYKKNGGVSSARNFGIDIARGQYIAFLDADDCWSDTSFTKEVWNEIVNSNSDIICFNFRQMDKDCIREIGRVDCENMNDKFRDSAVDSVYVHLCSLFYKKEFLNKKQLKFDESLRYFEDLFFKTKAVYLADKFYQFPVYLLEYRNNPASVMHRSNEIDFRKQKYEAYIKMESFFGKQYTLEKRTTHYINARLAITYLSCIEDHCLVFGSYSKFCSLIDSEKLQLICSELNNSIITIPDKSKTVLNKLIRSPKTFYYSERMKQFFLNIRRNLYRWIVRV